MSELTQSQVGMLKQLQDGGLIALAVYGKRDLTVEVLSLPKCLYAGVKGIEELRERGLVRYGDRSPYKSGKSLPIVLTDAGRVAAGV